MTADHDSELAELFRAELEVHLATLNEGLLALEHDPTRSEFFPSMMRAAHSIKGAAKIMGVTPAVNVAHEIEDCFVAAGAGTLQLTSEIIDVLLEGVDLLGEAALATADCGEQVVAYLARIRRSIASRQSVNDAHCGVKQAGTDATGSRDGVVTYRPQGALDHTWVRSHFQDILADLELAGATVCIHLADVVSIDAHGVALLATIGSVSKPKVGVATRPAKLVGASAPLQRLLVATGLADRDPDSPGGC